MDINDIRDESSQHVKMLKLKTFGCYGNLIIFYSSVIQNCT